ncbi:hypothetical protein E1200_22595 [Actinomadura sp. GC306]|uniref:hypothetical protein n=1 Tax=Actinomadura sp. GC306 TaxID=2530367 RepID=UPI001043E460|nr:hypothetical protein [Actinomadura sp. GC306]TDC63335.1 hypothetical protein E1200_22595 [Actinomadura sp. GC306]
MLRVILVSLVVLSLPACGDIKVTDREKSPQRQVTLAQLETALIDSYQDLKIAYADTQDHFQRLEDRLLKDAKWPAVGGDCMKRLSPSGFVRLLGEAGTQAPATVRAWGTAANDIRLMQFLVALPDDGAKTAALTPLPKKCLDFEIRDPERFRFTVTERPLELGDGGRILRLGTPGQNDTSGQSTVVFAYQGVLAIIIYPYGDPTTFAERALKQMQETL